MPLADLDKYHTLVKEWDDVINSSLQINSWIQNMLNKITVLQQDVNYINNVSPQEQLYIANYINVLNIFIQTQPVLQPK